MDANHQLSLLVDTSDPEAVLREIVHVGALINKDFDGNHFISIFRDIQRLFQGAYPGYRACNTHYHDFAHTYQVTLAMSRLMHGASVAGVVFAEPEVQLGLTAALMHDTGYIQKNSDPVGTGAKYTLIHIDRSCAFLARYCQDNPVCGGYNMKDCSDILYCTGLSVNIAKIVFSSEKIAITGKILGSTDLLGQMADRLYLEKLPSLYREFQEGGLSQFASEFDLLKKTIDFYELTQKRFAVEFSGVAGYMRHHFRARWGVDRDLYQESIQRHIDYLQNILDTYRYDFAKGLRRRRKIGAAPIPSS
jgi:hypothetical protein